MNKFINEMFSSNENHVSSKRVLGSFCILFSMIVVFISLILDPKGVVDQSINFVITSFLTAGSALLGLGIIDNKKSNKINNDNINK